ncbi:homoserine kinase [Jeotgalibacillus alimentarius]|uniref:Homoserine kinase n=1 Tax=Jeotgalibacillus alimentarius TaxID=135826 RepID=A0A0C2VWJ6_9BACL|nr:homoserine kinase [Jeotgalibacillus alimentarius]KIL48781.1 homoserine kinase [Jeotgalibacillus alimentarius]
MTFSPFTVKTPASTANLGPGFDSIGLALPIYQKIDVQPYQQWKVSYEHEDFQDLPTDQSNLILQTINKVAAAAGTECPCAALTVSSEIPLSKGLGSSAAAISAGVSIANRLMDLGLTEDEQIRLASDIEGHPDNVSASIAGGLTVSRYADREVTTVSIPVGGFSVVIMAPEAELATKKSRGVLPDQLPYRDAVLSSAAANVMVAAFAAKDFYKAGQVMMKDSFHEPFRENFFPDLTDIKKDACHAGAFAVTISGAGPCISIFTEDTHISTVVDRLSEKYSSYQLLTLKPVNQGTLITEHQSNRLSV